MWKVWKVGQKIVASNDDVGVRDDDDVVDEDEHKKVNWEVGQKNNGLCPPKSLSNPSSLNYRQIQVGKWAKTKWEKQRGISYIKKKVKLRNDDDDDDEDDDEDSDERGAL